VANYISKYSGAQIDLSVASGSSVTGIIRDFNTLSGSSTSTLTIGGDANIGGVVYADQFVSSSGDLILDGNVSASGYISTQGNITASGNVSAVGSGSFGHVSSSGYIYFGDGTEALPSLAFGGAGQQDNGIYRRSNNTLGISAGGDGMMTIAPEGVTIGSTHVGNDLNPGANGLLVEGNITASANMVLTSSADHSLTFDKAGEEKFTFSHAGSGLFIQNDGTNQLAFIQDHDIRIYNSSGNETATFRDSGRVGIGTLSPQNQLHLSGSDGTTSGIRQSRAGSKIWSQEIDSSGRLQWSYRASEAGSKTTTFTLDDTGFVGIGTGGPSFPLDVESSEDILASFVSTDNKAVVQVRDDDTVGYISAENEILSIGGNTGANANNLNIITASGNVGIGTMTPTKALQVSGDISASGNLKIQGGLTVVGAITSSIVSSSIVFSSGSNIFGDADTDQHTFNGSISASSNLRVTGDISASDGTRALHYDVSENELNVGGATFYINKSNGVDVDIDNGTFVVDASANKIGIGNTVPTEALTVTGDISASADLHLGAHASIRNLSGNLTIRPEGDLKLGTDSTDNVSIGRLDAGITTIFTKNGLNVTGSGAHITASGNISASGYVYADRFYNGANYIDIKTAGNDLRLQSEGGGDVIFHSERSWLFEDGSDNYPIRISNAGHITASGNLTVAGDISSSGDIYLENNNDIKFARADGTVQPVLKVDSNDDVIIGNNNLDDMILVTDEGTAMTLKGDGKVGIGTTTPSKELEIAGALSMSGALVVGQSPAGQHVSASNNEIEIIGNHPSHDNKIKFTNTHATIGGYQMGLNGGLKSFLISSGSTSAEFDTPIFQVSGSLARNVVSVNPGGSNGNTSITASLEVSGAFSDIRFNNLPTSDPGVAGQLWSNSGVLTVSSG